MTRRGIVLLIACAGLLYAYQFALVWGIGYAMGLPRPLAWISFFPSRLSGALTWLILVHSLAVLIISVPFAFLIARFGGPHGPAIALTFTLVLFVLFWLPSLTGFFDIMRMRVRVVTGFDQIKLILVLPLLVWLMRKLPSNNRVWTPPSSADR
jgi:hypothetical protein